MLNKIISDLINYAEKENLIDPQDEILIQNRLLEVFKADEFEKINVENIPELSQILNMAIKYAQENGLVENNTVSASDLFDTKVMGLLTPLSSEVNNKFNKNYEDSPESATDYFYSLSKKVNYIREDRIKKDMHWKYPSEYGDLDITINLSKPEKDPKEIAAARQAKASGYPKCLLCVENEGYAGRVNHPARQNHRIISIELLGEKWALQYSPYTYYNEHCIVFNKKHTPMKTDINTYKKLLEFVEKFPHYFVGSNADLPIVGGSILSHEHFQGGRYEFAMAKAPVEHCFDLNTFPGVKAGIVKWPMSVIRLRSEDKNKLALASDYIQSKWKEYSDESCDILAFSDGQPHNCITPIARKRGTYFEIDLVLRNNRTNAEFPDGIFHPHKELHNIKKENIGLIEVMGLAVLPSRLKNELELIAQALKDNKSIEQIEGLEHHINWVNDIKQRYTDFSDAEELIKKETGAVFLKVLEHAAVFKRNEKGKDGFLAFASIL